MITLRFEVIAFPRNSALAPESTAESTWMLPRLRFRTGTGCRIEDCDADKAAKPLRFVVHFVGDLHQPLHDEDDGDKGGNGRHVTFDGKPDNLHWVWDTGLLEHINRNPEALAAELESKITPQDRAEWDRGGIEEWALEGHRLAQTAAYGDLGNENPAPITAAYEQQADPVVELQLEKAGMRLAWLLNGTLN